MPQPNQNHDEAPHGPEFPPGPAPLIPPDKLRLLIGQTIVAARQVVDPRYDDRDTLRLSLGNGVVVDLVGRYDEWTARSRDEYRVYLSITEPDVDKGPLP